MHSNDIYVNRLIPMRLLFVLFLCIVLGDKVGWLLLFFNLKYRLIFKLVTHCKKRSRKV